MKTLSELKTMSDDKIQGWLRRVDSEADAKTLAVALLGSDDEIKECVFRNMSNKAVTVLKEEIEKSKNSNIREHIINLNASILEKLI